MFTVCPKCALTLVVTAADLRVAQGYVRCGRCLNVFNALARLSEERPGTEPPTGGEAVEGLVSAEEAAPVEEPASTEDAAPAEEPAPVEERAHDTPQQQVTSSFVEDDETGEIEFELDPSILVTSVRAPEALEETGDLDVQESPPAPGETAPARPAIAPPQPAMEALHPAVVPAQPAVTAAHASLAPAQSTTAGSAPVTESRAEPASVTDGSPANVPLNATSVSERAESSLPKDTGVGLQTNTVQEGPEAAIELAAQPPRAGLAWKLGAGALAVLLLLQIVNHYRDALASSPGIGRPLSTLYSALGVKLAPRWNIHAYDVRQLGASAAGVAAGQIVVRASVKNTASRAQPLPLLRVTLQDRFGNRIAARDVPPGDYLPSSVARASLLAAGSRVDATMVFVDPGPQAVGFEIDACLRRQGGEVACAHGP